MIRMLHSVLLALVLALTSQSMAVARGASAATGQMVLCTGSGPVAVYLDASGQPTSAPHICPDSALNVVFDGDASRIVVPQRLVFVVPARHRATSIFRAEPSVTPPSRAPPLTV